jgi:hypothetical protein
MDTNILKCDRKTGKRRKEVKKKILPLPNMLSGIIFHIIK